MSDWDDRGGGDMLCYGRIPGGDEKEIQVDAAGVVAVSTASGGTITVTSNGATLAQTPTITAGAYTAGDNVGGLLTFVNAALASGGGGVIKNMIIIDDAGQDGELELWLFDQTFTAGADNAAWAPSAADLENCIGVISTSGETWRAAGTPSVITVEIAMRYDLDGTSLFGRLVTRTADTYVATTDLTCKVALLQD